MSHIEIPKHTIDFSERAAWATYPRHALLERQAIPHAQHRRQIRTKGHLDRRQRRSNIPTHRRGAHQLPRAGHFRDFCQQTHHWSRAVLHVRAAAVQMLTHQQNGRKLPHLQ